MILYAYIDPTLYKQYCRIHWLDDTSDSQKQYLRAIGTYSVSTAQPTSEHVAIPSGSCIRLLSTEKYSRISAQYMNLHGVLFPSETKKGDILTEKTPIQISGWKSRWYPLCWTWRF
jgi:hypothetical protein